MLKQHATHIKMPIIRKKLICSFASRIELFTSPRFFSTLIPPRKRIKRNSKPTRLLGVPFIAPLRLRVQYDNVLKMGTRVQSSSFSMVMLDTVKNAQVAHDFLEKRLSERTGPSKRNSKVVSQSRLLAGTDLISENVAQIEAIINYASHKKAVEQSNLVFPPDFQLCNASAVSTPESPMLGFHCRIGIIVRLTGRAVLRIRLRRRLRNVFGSSL